jgi:hypothetical protein
MSLPRIRPRKLHMCSTNLVHTNGMCLTRHGALMIRSRTKRHNAHDTPQPHEALHPRTSARSMDQGPVRQRVTRAASRHEHCQQQRRKCITPHTDTACAATAPSPTCCAAAAPHGAPLPQLPLRLPSRRMPRAAACRRVGRRVAVPNESRCAPLSRRCRTPSSAPPKPCTVYAAASPPLVPPPRRRPPLPMPSSPAAPADNARRHLLISKRSFEARRGRRMGRRAEHPYTRTAANIHPSLQRATNCCALALDPALGSA